MSRKCNFLRRKDGIFLTVLLSSLQSNESSSFINESAISQILNKKYRSVSLMFTFEERCWSSCCIRSNVEYSSIILEWLLKGTAGISKFVVQFRIVCGFPKHSLRVFKKYECISVLEPNIFNCRLIIVLLSYKCIFLVSLWSFSSTCTISNKLSVAFEKKKKKILQFFLILG